MPVLIWSMGAADAGVFVSAGSLVGTSARAEFDLAFVEVLLELDPFLRCDVQIFGGVSQAPRKALPPKARSHGGAGHVEMSSRFDQRAAVLASRNCSVPPMTSGCKVRLVDASSEHSRTA
jgi:hypothetical protein